MRKYFPYAALVVIAVALDQWVKMLAETRLTMHEQVDLLPFFALFRTYNTGVAFSMFSWIGDKGLIAISLGVIAFMLYLAARTSSALALAGFALVIGGAVGNLIDRAIYGHVIDYFLFHTPVWSFAVFNLADAFITVGAALILLHEVFLNR
ncbi:MULTISPECIES: signal peptidase II [Mesorhizobium]|uniref:Lipoprotein signal peptidase n=1 Tax=Mesorhizobium denitrificans TaxID=2294114 RepID=A0A371XKD3_9HYPH|nr:MULTISPECIES: signal peptidase II [Mesorhizobium]RFC69649.1 signal peptidase II [Mesorhizobium denitrificans]